MLCVPPAGSLTEYLAKSQSVFWLRSSDKTSYDSILDKGEQVLASINTLDGLGLEEND